MKKTIFTAFVGIFVLACAIPAQAELRIIREGDPHSSRPNVFASPRTTVGQQVHSARKSCAKSGSGLRATVKKQKRINDAARKKAKTGVASFSSTKEIGRKSDGCCPEINIRIKGHGKAEIIIKTDNSIPANPTPAVPEVKVNTNTPTQQAPAAPQTQQPASPAVQQPTPINPAPQEAPAKVEPSSSISPTGTEYVAFNPEQQVDDGWMPSLADLRIGSESDRFAKK